MLWKIILTTLAFYNDISKDSHLKSRLGPQTPQEEEIARKALHGNFYGGDMILPEGFDLKNAIKNDLYHWEKEKDTAIVPYVIDDTLKNRTELILRAMKQYEKVTCVKFIAKRKTDANYVKLYKGTGCNSAVGRQHGEQLLSLGDGCYYIGSVVHELGHAIGLYHEHQRSDRDDFLFIYGNNVTTGQKVNFQRTKQTEELLYNTFDYNSIMIYGNYAFSKQPGTLMTMEAKNGRKLEEPFGKPGLDSSDIERIKKLYKCKK